MDDRESFAYLYRLAVENNEGSRYPRSDMLRKTVFEFTDSLPLSREVVGNTVHLRYDVETDHGHDMRAFLETVCDALRPTATLRDENDCLVVEVDES